MHFCFRNPATNSQTMHQIILQQVFKMEAIFHEKVQFLLDFLLFLHYLIYLLTGKVFHIKNNNFLYNLACFLTLPPWISSHIVPLKLKKINLWNWKSQLQSSLQGKTQVPEQVREVRFVLERTPDTGTTNIAWFLEPSQPLDRFC